MKDDAFQYALLNALAAADSNTPANKPVKGAKVTRAAYANIPEPVLLSLVRCMPDLQSAILLLVAWHACRQRALKQGDLAGKPVARLSHADIAKTTGRRKDCVKRSLTKLKDKKLVISYQENNEKTVYSINNIVE